MLELDNQHEKSTQILKRLINTNIKVDQHHRRETSAIHTQLERLLKRKISQKQVLTILSSWHFYQVLMNIGNNTDLSKIKDKVDRASRLINSISQDFYNNDLTAFSLRNESLFLTKSISEIEQMAHHLIDIHFKNKGILNYYLLQSPLD